MRLYAPLALVVIFLFMTQPIPRAQDRNSESPGDPLLRGTIR
jgi:hypothetical protein